jgi:hypothetical protein
MADERKSDEIEFDLDAFESQIDEKIDDLFAPSHLTPATEEMPHAQSAEPAPDAPVPAPPDAPPQEPQTAPQTDGFDLTAFEAQIDQEIDTLFIPNDEAPPPDAPTLKASPPDAAHQEPQTAPQTDGFDLTAFEAQIDQEIDTLFIPAAEVDSPSDASIGKAEANRAAEAAQTPVSAEPAEQPPQAAAVPPRQVEAPVAAAQPGGAQEMVKLLEAVSIAYLSLDWDFSAENVSKLENALAKLEPYCREIKETDSLLKMFRTVLVALRAKPESLDQRLIEFIRDAQALLKLLLLSEGKIGAYEREHLKSMLNRFHTMTRKPSPKEEAAQARPGDAEAAPAEAPEAKPPVFSTPSQPFAPPQEVVGAIDWRPLKEIGDWMAAYGNQACEAIRKLELERNRLLQLEEVLAKTPALAVVTSRMEKIRSNLEAQLSHLKQGESEWSKRAEWLNGFMKNVEHAALTHSPASADPLPPVPAGEAAKEPPVQSDTSDSTIRELVYIFDVSKRSMAVPASHVVKFTKGSGRRMKKILLHGYAGLHDFKPLFRSIKSGLLGDWGALPANTLKTFQFTVVPPDVLGVPETSCDPAGVMLISNGRQHAMIVSESSNVGPPAEAEITLSKPGVKGVLGTIRTVTGSSVEVIDVDFLLNQLDGEISE